MYNHTYNDKKWNQKNIKECDKPKSHISRKLRIICISSNNVRRPVSKTFTTLHPTTLYSTSLRYTFHLHGFLATRISTYVLIRGRSPLHTHYLRTVLRKKNIYHVMLSFFLFRRFSLCCVSRIHFRFSKQQTRHLLRT